MSLLEIFENWRRNDKEYSLRNLWHETNWAANTVLFGEMQESLQSIVSSTAGKRSTAQARDYPNHGRQMLALWVC